MSLEPGTYEIKIARLRFIELVRISGAKPVALSGALLVKAGLPVPGPQQRYPFRVSRIERWKEQPVAQRFLDEQSKGLVDAGFREMFSFESEQRTTGVENDCCRAFLSVDGAIIAQLMWTTRSKAPRRDAIDDKSMLRTVLLSYREDGTKIATSNGRRMFDPRPGDDGRYRRNAGAAALLHAHTPRLSSSPSPLLTFADGDAVLARIERDNNDGLEHMAARGLLERVADAADSSAAAAAAAAAAVSPSAPVEHVEHVEHVDDGAASR